MKCRGNYRILKCRESTLYNPTFAPSPPNRSESHFIYHAISLLNSKWGYNESVIRVTQRTFFIARCELLHICFPRKIYAHPSWSKLSFIRENWIKMTVCADCIRRPGKPGAIKRASYTIDKSNLYAKDAKTANRKKTQAWLKKKKSERGDVELCGAVSRLISRAARFRRQANRIRAWRSRKVSNGTREHNSFMFVTGCYGSEI